MQFRKFASIKLFIAVGVLILPAHLFAQSNQPQPPPPVQPESSGQGLELDEPEIDPKSPIPPFRKNRSHHYSHWPSE